MNECAPQVTALSNCMYELNTRHFDKFTGCNKRGLRKDGPCTQALYTSERENAPGWVCFLHKKELGYMQGCDAIQYVYTVNIVKGVYHSIPTTLLSIGTYSSTRGYIVLHRSKNIINLSNLRLVLQVEWCIEIGDLFIGAFAD